METAVLQIKLSNGIVNVLEEDHMQVLTFVKRFVARGTTLNGMNVTMEISIIMTVVLTLVQLSGDTNAKMEQHKDQMSVSN